MPLASLTSFVGDHGLWAVFALMLADALLPAASELVMAFGGALAAGAVSARLGLFGDPVESRAWAYVLVSLAGTVGYTLGSLVGWGIGAYGGRPLLERRGRWLHLSPEKLDRAERWFSRWGDWAVFLGRLTPVLRSFISIPAGVFRSPLRRYTVLTLAASAIWCFALSGAGFALGEGYESFHRDFRYADYAVAAGVLALAALVIVRRRRSSRLARRAADPAR